MNAFIRPATLVALIAITGLLSACGPDSDQSAGKPPVTETENAEAAKAETVETAATDEQENANRITREGVIVEFLTKPTSADRDKVVASDWADVTFRITDASTGEPIKGRYPAAWMDLAETWKARGEKVMSCDGRVKTYLQGIVGVRPMIDLNSHFLLVLNADASISVIDPAVGIPVRADQHGSARRRLGQDRGPEKPVRDYAAGRPGRADRHRNLRGREKHRCRLPAHPGRAAE
jgi:hypothetical protein